MSDALRIIEILPNRSHSATVLFLHGLGDRADNMVEWIRFQMARDFHIAGHVKIIFATAPKQPFTMFGGKALNVWFDASGDRASVDIPERKASFALIDRLMDDLIQKEVQLGIPLNRIIVGGFSMGGNMSLHIGYRTYRQLAGVFALSVYLSYDTAVFDALESKPVTSADPAPELLMFHGDEDELIPYDMGDFTFRELTRLGVRGVFHRLRGIKHEIRRSELLYVEQWIRDRLPALPNDLVNKL